MILLLLFQSVGSYKYLPRIRNRKYALKAKGIEEFFADVERRAAYLEEGQKAVVLERLTQARTLIDSTDALQWLAAWKTPEERKSSYKQYGF